MVPGLVVIFKNFTKVNQVSILKLDSFIPRPNYCITSEPQPQFPSCISMSSLLTLPYPRIQKCSEQQDKLDMEDFSF